MMPNTTTDLYTTVKNVSGVTQTFGFLGKHGKRLANNETYSVRGDLVGALGAERSTRRFAALERALLDEALVIVKSPAVYLLDRDGVGTQVLAKDDRVLGTQEPSTEGGGDFRDNDYNDD
jgi:hypothetical protein